MQQEQEGNIVDKGIDLLLMLPGVQCKHNVRNGHAPAYSGPLDPVTVVSAAKRAFDAISQNETAMFVLSADCVENASFQSPLAEDAIMLEADGVHVHSRIPNSSDFGHEDSSISNQCHSGFDNPPIPGDLIVTKSQPSSVAIDLATRKKKMVEWLCHNVHHLNDLNQLPFNSSELWRLHQHFFTPTIQETCSQNSSYQTSPLPIDEMNSPPGSSILSEPCNAMPLPTLTNVPPVSAPVMNLNNSSGTIPMLKRKVSYRCLHDASANMNSIPPSHSTIHSRNQSMGAQSVSKLIEGRMHGMQPKSKRARKSKSRISILPRIRAKLNSFLDSDHQKALGLMRQLHYVEKSLLNNCIYTLNCAMIPTYLSDTLASDAEMILLDM